MNDIKTTYRDVEITYNEFSDSWNCELFSKPAETLAKAKERIDKKLDTEKKEPFKRFNAFVRSVGYGAESWPLVEVTSLTEDGKEAWVSTGKERKKVGSSYGNNPIPLYPETPENTALVKEIHELELAITKINKRISDATGKMQIWKP